MIFRSLQSLVMICLSVAWSWAQTTSAVQQKTLLGFDLKGSDLSVCLEKQFDSFPQERKPAANAMKRLFGAPASPRVRPMQRNADFIAGLFARGATRQRSSRFDVLFPTPKTRLLK